MKLREIKVVNFCDKIILFSLYAIAFFLPISKAIIESFSILAIVCYLIKKFIQRQGIPKSKLNFAIFIYLLICFFSIFISSNFKISARTFFAKTLQDIAFFFVVVDTLNNERKIKTMVYIMLASSLLLGVDGIYQCFTLKDFIRHRPHAGLPRIHATFSTSNDFGCYLYSVIPFILACFFRRYKFKLFKFLFAVLFVLIFTCLLFTVSRGAWFAFAGGMLFMSIWIQSLGVFLLMLGIFVISTQQFYYPMLRERLDSFFVFGDSSSLDRMTIWETAWKMFMYKPWQGIGLGTFMFNFSKFIEGYQYGVPYAHNCYLQMASEIGIIGLLSFLTILILFFSNGIEIISEQKKTFSWYILLASLTAVLGYCVQMAVDTIFYSLDLGMLFWLLLGLGTATMRSIELEISK